MSPEETFGLHPHSLRLIVRSSRIYQVFWFVLMLVLAGTTVWFGVNNHFPLPVLVFSVGGLTFIAFIQFFPLVASFKKTNWMAKFYEEGVLLQMHKNNGDHLYVLVPTAAIRSFHVRHQNRKISRRSFRHRGKYHTAWSLLTYLEIDAKKSDVNMWQQEDQSRQKKKRMSVKFLYYPVTKTESGYRIELKSSRTRTVPSISTIKKYLKTRAVPYFEVTETLNLASEHDDQVFDLKVAQLAKEGFFLDAIDAIRKKHDLSLSQAREFLEQCQNRENKSNTPSIF